MNPKLFKPLTKLSIVNLNKNVCVSESFSGATEIENLEEAVEDKCQYDELEGFVRTAEKLTDANSFLESELKECKKGHSFLINEKNNCSQNFEYNRQQHENLKYQCENLSKDLRANLEYKHKENTEINNKLYEKDTEIANLKQKLEGFKGLGFDI